MSTTIAEHPVQFSFSKNEIRYVFNSSDMSAAGFFVRVALYYRYINQNTYTLLKSYTKQPNSDGKTYLYINDILDSLLTPNIPLSKDAITPCSTQILRFYVAYAEGNNTNPNPSLDNSDLSYTSYIIKGGIERQRYNAGNFFAWLNTNKQFLSWQPERLVHYDENIWLTVLFTDMLENKLLEVIVTDTEGQAYTQTFNIFNSNFCFYHINVSPSFLNLQNLVGTAKIYKYTVAVKYSSSATYYTKPKTFYINYRPVYNIYDLLWINSLGGVDTVRVRGDVLVGVSKDVNQINAGFSLSDAKDIVKHPDIAVNSVVKSDYYKGDIGFVEDTDAQDALTDLLISRWIYQWFDSRWVPLLNIQSNLDKRNESDRKFSFPIEWQLAITNEVFTPKNILLGMVNGNGVTCSPVIIASVDLPNGSVGSAYYASIPLTGDAPFLLSNLVLPDGMEATILNNNVIISGTPTVETNSAIISFTISNCNGGNTADFSQTIHIRQISIPGNCSPVVIGGVTLPDGQVGTAYALTIPLAGDAPFGLSNIVAPQGLAITISGSNALISGTPTIQGTSQQVSFTITNCNGNNSANFYQTISIKAMLQASITQVSNTNTGVGGKTTQVFEIGTNIVVGATYNLSVYSHTVSVTTVQGNTPAIIASKLAAAINATTAAQWNSAGSAPATGTNGFPPTATANNNQITIVLNYQNQFAASVY